MPPTEFEAQVYAACKQIPKGSYSTYGAMARFLETSPRAVGQALRKNPTPDTVPCYRVIKSDLMIGGFCGKTDTVTCGRKKSLLEADGISFSSEGKADALRLFTAFY